MITLETTISPKNYNSDRLKEIGPCTAAGKSVRNNFCCLGPKNLEFHQAESKIIIKKMRKKFFERSRMV